MHLNVASFNIRRSFFNKRIELEKIASDHHIDIMCLQEVDLNYVDENYPPILDGYKTYYPFQNGSKVKTRVLMFVKKELAEHCLQTTVQEDEKVQC